MSIYFKSPALKAERGYTDPKSYVRENGSEVLFGRDWTNRKKELWERAGGRCEYVSPRRTMQLGFTTERCGADSGDPCHIIPRHPVRDDRLSNLKFYCRKHHILTDAQTPKRQLHWRKRDTQAIHNR